MRHRRFKTAYRLGAAFTAILVLFAAALAVELGALHRIAQAEDELARLDHAKHAGHMVAAQIRELYIHQAHVFIVEDRSHLGHYAQVAAATRAATDHLVGLGAAAEERRRAGEIAQLAQAFDEGFRRDIDAALEHKDRAALLALHDRAERQMNDIVARSDELNHIFETGSAAALAGTGTLRSQARLATLVCFGLAILVAAVVGLLLMRSILRPIAALRAGAARVGAGDLRARIEMPGRDEFAELATTFNQMTADLARNQDDLLRAQRLASIGQVAAGVAHEINNPLGVILGYVKLLRREDGAKEELQIIEDEAEQCRRIVQDLLDLARPQRLELAPIDLAELTGDAVQRLKESGKLRDIEVAVTAAGPVPARADEAKLRQVVVNVLVNALEAATGRVEITAQAQGAGATLVVADDGPGMAPEVLAHVFDPFFTTKRTGTGMGLAIAQAIVDAHGGRIELASAPGAGTRAAIWLPAPAEERRP
jgi:signal transduction histidine kinase